MTELEQALQMLGKAKQARTQYARGALDSALRDETCGLPEIKYAFGYQEGLRFAYLEIENIITKLQEDV